MNSVPNKVLIPCWIFEQAKNDKKEIKRLVEDYMSRYPDYRLIGVSGSFAVCEKSESLV